MIGAGLSGLFAGRILQDHGLSVRVFEKNSEVGGRTATLGKDDGGADLGAQYFTQRDSRLRPYLESWLEDGLVAPWEGRIAAAKHGQITFKENTFKGSTFKDNPVKRYVGVPGMDALAQHLATDLDIAFGHAVQAVQTVQTEGIGWQLVNKNGQDLGRFDVVLVTTPPCQAERLLAEVPPLAEAAGAVRMDPCWAVTARFAHALALDFDGAFVHDAPLSWVARNASKPGRSPEECWVLHASPEWSASHRDDTPEIVTAALLRAFFEAAGMAAQPPISTYARLWDDSIAASPLNVGCLWDAERRLGACGDWCHGSRVEGALLSGMAAAGRVLDLPHVEPGQGELFGSSESVRS